MKRPITLILALSMIMLLILSACSAPKTGDLIGVWTGAWEWNGARINGSIEFNRDGTYSYDSYRDNVYSNTDSGYYTIEGNKVVLVSRQNGGKMIFQYGRGKLTQNGHFFSKE